MWAQNGLKLPKQVIIISKSDSASIYFSKIHNIRTLQLNNLYVLILSTSATGLLHSGCTINVYI